MPNDKFNGEVCKKNLPAELNDSFSNYDPVKEIRKNCFVDGCQEKVEFIIHGQLNNRSYCRFPVCFDHVKNGEHSAYNIISKISEAKNLQEVFQK